MTDFFTQLTEALEKENSRRPGMNISLETLKALNAEPEKESVPSVQEVPGNVVVPEQKIAPEQSSAAQSTPQTPPENAPVRKLVPGTLEHLCETVRNCRNCPLCETRLNAVPGEGDPHARLMFIGEGPGADEDRQGRPFVGAAGQLLDKMIGAMHLAREDVYIANIVKCRPPGNRMPGEDEAAACIGYLKKQIELIQPEVIVLLGGTALHFLLQIDGITKYRGRWQSYNNIAVMPTFHPAFLLRKAEAKREAWHDLKLVMAKLGIAV